MKESVDLILANKVWSPNSLGNWTQLVATIVDKFAPIWAARWGTNLAQCGQLLTCDQFCRERKFPQLAPSLSALRCILLTNNCGQSFSPPPPSTGSSKVSSNQKALHFALGPTWQQNVAHIENVPCLCCLVKNVAALGLVWLPRESCRQMTLSTCALPSARMAHQLEGATREWLSKA